MKKFTLKQIANSCNGKYVGELSKKTAVSSIVVDSRQVKEGSLFIAIKGDRVDGHDFMEECYKNGAICMLCEQPPKNEEIPYILVDSTLTAVRYIAKAYREMFKIPFIGITGSAGKTSTKEMVHSVLSEKYNTHKTEGNFNNELGVPLTIFKLKKEHEIAVIEMGISNFNEMERLSEIVQPDYCIITNIGSSHLENLKDRDGVLKAKTEMFLHMNKNGTVILNGDDDKLKTIEKVNNKKPILYGLSKNNDYYANNIIPKGIEGISCSLHYKNTKLDVTIPGMGKHMVINTLAALALAKELKMDDKDIIKGINNYKTIGGRSTIIKTENYTIIDDSYNASPTSVSSSIDMLSNINNGRKVCILGDMKELGTLKREMHTQIGEYCGDMGIDLLITVGDLAEYMHKGAISKNVKSVHFKNNEEAVKKVKELLLKDDIILVKASHSMKFKEIVKGIS